MFHIALTGPGDKGRHAGIARRHHMLHVDATRSGFVYEIERPNREVVA